VGVITTTLVISGILLRTDPQVMEAVVERRAALGQFEIDRSPAEFISVLDCRQLGREAWIVWPTSAVTFHRIGDCATARHRAALVARGVAGEVSYPVARRHAVFTGHWPQWRPLDAPLENVRIYVGRPPRSKRRAALPL
jgi:hypothetical protein